MERNSTSGMPIWGLTLVFLGLLPFGTWCGPRWATAAPAQPVYNVTDFGANGSDNEDDTSAFKAALAAAQKNAQVNVPPGVYIISDALSVAAGVRLEGAGMQRTQLQVALAEDAEKIENFISTDGSGTEIVDLEIDGGGHVENIIRSSGGALNRASASSRPASSATGDTQDITIEIEVRIAWFIRAIRTCAAATLTSLN